MYIKIYNVKDRVHISVLIFDDCKLSTCISRDLRNTGVHNVLDC